MNEISCTVIFGSPRSDGNTAEMLRAFKDKIEYPLKYDAYNAYDMNVMPCTDCGHCKKEQRCAFDDMEKLYASIENSRLLVIATPVYNMSFPAPLKAILDRFQRYYNARFSLGIRPAIARPGKAVLLAAAGSEKEDGMFMKKQLAQSLSVMNTELCACGVISGLDKRKLDGNDEKITECANAVNSYLSDLSD